jgi:hypothetical protein
LRDKGVVEVEELLTIRDRLLNIQQALLKATGLSSFMPTHSNANFLFWFIFLSGGRGESNEMRCGSDGDIPVAGAGYSLSGMHATGGGHTAFPSEVKGKQCEASEPASFLVKDLRHCVVITFGLEQLGLPLKNIPDIYLCKISTPFVAMYAQTATFQWFGSSNDEGSVGEHT